MDSGSHGVDNVPSPYARLNQLTLEMLASNGQASQITRLLSMVKQAEQVRGWVGGTVGVRESVYVCAYVSVCVCVRVCVCLCVYWHVHEALLLFVQP